MDHLHLPGMVRRVFRKKIEAQKIRNPDFVSVKVNR